MSNQAVTPTPMASSLPDFDKSDHHTTIPCPLSLVVIPIGMLRIGARDRVLRHLVEEKRITKIADKARIGDRMVALARDRQQKRGRRMTLLLKVLAIGVV